MHHEHNTGICRELAHGIAQRCIQDAIMTIVNLSVGSTRGTELCLSEDEIEDQLQSLRHRYPIYNHSALGRCTAQPAGLRLVVTPPPQQEYVAAGTETNRIFHKSSKPRNIQLSEDVISHIFRFLRVRDLITCSLTCKTWHTMIMHKEENIWRRLCSCEYWFKIDSGSATISWREYYMHRFILGKGWKSGPYTILPKSKYGHSVPTGGIILCNVNGTQNMRQNRRAAEPVRDQRNAAISAMATHRRSEKSRVGGCFSTASTALSFGGQSLISWDLESVK